MPQAPTPSLTLDLRDSRVRALLAEPAALWTWEVVRRFDGPVSVRQLSEMVGREQSATQGVLDALVALRLVVARAANAAARMVRYEAATQALVVVFDSGDAEQVSEIRRLGARFKELSRAGCMAIEEYPSPEAFAFEYARPTRLDAEQIARLKSLMKQVRNLLEQAASTSTIEEGGGGVFCTHQVLIEVHPCKPRTLPLPQIVLAPRAEIEAARSLVAGSGMPSLSMRERTVALAMAAGKSRPAIASELGLSVNTVATVSKRVYAKLKVRSRAELANKLRG